MNKKLSGFFIIEVDITGEEQILKDGTMVIKSEQLVDMWELYGDDYSSDEFYALKKDLHSSWSDASKDIIKELFEYFEII